MHKDVRPEPQRNVVGFVVMSPPAARWSTCIMRPIAYPSIRIDIVEGA